MHAPEVQKQSYSKKEAAKMLGVSVRTIERSIRRGEIRRFKIQGCVRIHQSEIEKVIKGGSLS